MTVHGRELPFVPIRGPNVSFWIGNRSTNPGDPLGFRVLGLTMGLIAAGRSVGGAAASTRFGAVR